LPFIDIGEKSWPVYEENWPKNRYNTTPHASPEAALHTGRRPTRSTPHLNATGGGERPEPPLQLPRRPRGRAPPGRRRTRLRRNHQNTPQVPLSGGHPKRGPKRQSDARAPPTPDPARDLGFPPENPSGEQETPASTTPSRSMRRPQASPSSVPAGRQDRAFAQRRVPRPRARQQGPAQNHQQQPLTRSRRRAEGNTSRSQRRNAEDHRGRSRNVT
jgi:hypothetical protein